MPRSAIIWTRSRELSLNVRYHRTHRTIISWSKCRTPEEFLCGGRFCHPSRYRWKPSLSSLHQNSPELDEIGASREPAENSGGESPIRGYTREAEIRPNRRHRSGNDRIACSYWPESLPGLVTIGGPESFLHPSLGAEEAFLCWLRRWLQQSRSK
jgi:hypothetical protein